MKFLLLVFLFTSTFVCTAESQSKLEVGQSTLTWVKQHYKVEKVGHSSAPMSGVYEVHLSSLNERECLFKDLLEFYNIIFDDSDMLIGIELMYQGNQLAQLDSCLKTGYARESPSKDERVFYGEEVRKYSNGRSHVTMFFTGPENTTRYFERLIP